MREYSCYIGGVKAGTKLLEVRNPHTGEVTGTVATVDRCAVDQAIETALAFKATPTRYERYQILDRTRTMLDARRGEISKLMTAESGLCIRETTYEVGRAIDVLVLASHEALRDDGQVFSCDISPGGKSRKIFSMREPLSCAVAITPFNHPLNQVAHKVAPAVAAGTPMILKPSEKTPLTALWFAELLYEAGLPKPMLSVLLGPTAAVAQPLVEDQRVQLLSFTGSAPVGKKIAHTAGYKRIVLELGGNDPMIVLDDADLDLAVTLAAEGSYRNSGQRCTAVKRILVHRKIHDEFTARLVEKTKEYVCADPMNPETKVGTVIDEQSAMHLHEVIQKAIDKGARVVIGGERRGAQLAPTVIANVPRDAEMVTCESFGPLAPVLPVENLDDAIDYANSTSFGLSSSIVTSNLSNAIHAIRRLRCGTVNVNEVPGFRIESTPFGGIKDSGLGVKEGVVESMKHLTSVKTFSLPW